MATSSVRRSPRPRSRDLVHLDDLGLERHDGPHRVRIVRRRVCRRRWRSPAARHRTAPRAVEMPLELASEAGTPGKPARAASKVAICRATCSRWVWRPDHTKWLITRDISSLAASLAAAGICSAIRPSRFMPLSSWIAQGDRVLAQASAQSSISGSEPSTGRSFAFKKTCAVRGISPVEDVDRRLGNECAQMLAFENMGDKERLAAGAAQRRCSAIQPQAVGIGFDDSRTLGSAGSVLQKTPIAAMASRSTVMVVPACSAAMSRHSVTGRVVVSNAQADKMTGFCRYYRKFSCFGQVAKSQASDRPSVAFRPLLLRPRVPSPSSLRAEIERKRTSDGTGKRLGLPAAAAARDGYRRRSASCSPAARSLARVTPSGCWRRATRQSTTSRATASPAASSPARGAGSFCEFKGTAGYWSLREGGTFAQECAWSYADPTPSFAALRGHLAVYPQAMDACFVDDEKVTPQPGGFYGGWITQNLVGPFKGAPGTSGW